MAMSMSVTQERLQRLTDERNRTTEKMEDLIGVAEEEKRDLNEHEEQQLGKYRERIEHIDGESVLLATDLDRATKSVDASKVIRVVNEADPSAAGGGAVHYRTFAEYARDELIVRRPDLVSLAAPSDISAMRAQAEERLDRALQNVTSTTVEGLIQATHMTEIMDIINQDRPVVSSGRDVPLDRGSLTYPQITARPAVLLQSAEKTEAGTTGPAVVTRTMAADTYLGATNISWQAVNWSNPDVLSLYFQLASEEYARQTEGAACEVLESAAIGTVGTSSGRLGTTGTESFGAWRSAVSAGIAAINTATGSRHRTSTLYLSGNRFYQLATLGTDQTTQMSPVGAVDMGSMTGTFMGLNVVGSYGFDQDTAIVGDASALLIGENNGNPVELRVVEPRIGGYEVGLIGAFKAAVFDVNRFSNLGTHL